MADLIDRKSAIDEAYAVIVDDAVYDVVQVETLEALPSVDAVEVVRCKECVNCEYDSIFNQYWCDGKRNRSNWGKNNRNVKGEI